jgi:hypothetical protein
MWSLPMALISHHSPYLKAMSSGSVIFPKAHINLPDDDSAVFNLLWNGCTMELMMTSHRRHLRTFMQDVGVLAMSFSATSSKMRYGPSV